MASFTVSLDDDVSGPANKAAGAVKSLSDQFDALQKSMAGQGGWGGISAEQEKNLAFHQANVKAATSEKDILAKIAEEQKKNLANHDQDAAARAGFAKMQEEQQKTAHQFKQLTASGDEFSEQMAALGSTLESVVVPAFTAAAAVAATWGRILYEAMSLAVELTQQKDALRATFDVFTGGMGGKLLDDLESLAAELPFTADKLNAWAKGLLAAGVSGDALRTSIRAIASATAIMGETGGAAAEGLIKRFAMMAEAGQKVTLDRRILSQLAEAGVSVQALAKALGVAPEKLGKMTIGAKELGAAMQKALIAQGEGPLKQMGNTWASISAKLREGFEDAFEDLGDLVGPFMSALRSFASEFFAGGVAANDFKGVVKNALTVAFEVATKFVNFLHWGFLEIQLAVLQARVALKPVTSVLSDIGIGAGAVHVALYILKGTVIVLTVVFGLLATAVALVALPFVMAGTAIYFIVKGIMALVGVISGAIDHFDNLKAKVDETTGGMLSSIASFVTGALTTLWNLPIDAVLIGGQFVLGLVQAITTGQGPVADAVRALAMTAVNTIKGALGIKSPSKVMMQMGDYAAQGLVMGLSANDNAVRDAATGTASATVAGAAAGTAGAVKGTGGPSVHIELHEGAIQIHGSGSAVEMTEEALTVALERIGLRLAVAA